jgi:hypothetical protein
MRARPYPHTRTQSVLILSHSLDLDLSSSLSHKSTRMRFSEASMEHEVSVALDGIAEGWVTVERKVALPPPPR